jgi:hypothetical protein
MGESDMYTTKTPRKSLKKHKWEKGSNAWDESIAE